jgi:hypothetical protein
METKNKIKTVTAESITLNDENGNWLGQIVLTSDGMIAAVTDYGNFGYAWRSYGENFKKFLCGLNVSYFSNKMSSGMSYVAHGRNIDKAADRFAEHILPVLQKYLMEQETE